MEKMMVPLSKEEFIARYKAHQKEKERIRRYIARRHNTDRLIMMVKKRSRTWN